VNGTAISHSVYFIKFSYFKSPNKASIISCSQKILWVSELHAMNICVTCLSHLENDIFLFNSVFFPAVLDS